MQKMGETAEKGRKLLSVVKSGNDSFQYYPEVKGILLNDRFSASRAVHRFLILARIKSRDSVQKRHDGGIRVCPLRDPKPSFTECLYFE
jgi:hypothetical protein